jgi:hypothetical protein
MKIAALALVALGITFVAACGDSSGTSSGDTSGGTSGSQQTCKSSHVCIGGSCNCGSDGKGSSCTNDTKCETECNVCA